MQKYQWSSLQTHDLSVFLTRISTRKNLLLYDARKRDIIEELFTFDPGEVCGNFTKAHSPYQVKTINHIIIIHIFKSF